MICTTIILGLIVFSSSVLVVIPTGGLSVSLSRVTRPPQQPSGHLLNTDISVVNVQELCVG